MNESEIRKWWSLFIGDDGMTEIRILGRYQYSGYFKSVDNLIKQLTPYMQLDDEQCYFTLNTINDACYGRQQCEKLVKSPKATTTDNDIIKRKWLLIDFDPKRATGVNASDEEFELAHQKTQEVYRYLRDLKFPNPVVCVSGNGWHLLYRIDFPNTSEITETIKCFLHTLNVMFGDDKVDIDEKVFNAGRICKLYGTTAKKGANLPDRPWRESKIYYAPSDIENVSIESIQYVANLLPKEQPPQNNYRGGNKSEKFDLVQFLNRHGITYKQVQSNDGTRYILDHCFFDENHKGKDAVLFQYNTGAVAYKCLHQSCSAKTWRDVRLLFEPDAYDYESQPPKQYRQIAPQIPHRPKYEIKDEVPEMGKKWYSMSDIKPLNLLNLEKVKTGIDELDRRIVGLHMSEVTLLSGSNSSGKSSWLNTLLMNIIDQNYKVALWSGELRADILKTWIQFVAAGDNKLIESARYPGRYEFVTGFDPSVIDRWLEGKFFLYNNEYGTKWEQIFSDMEKLLQMGVKVFMLDNLFTLDIDIFDGDKNNKQKELILQIKDFAKKKNVHIIMVAHPRKSMGFLRKNDISGTADLTNAVDNVFIIHRNNKDFENNIDEFYGPHTYGRYETYGNILEVVKNRMYGVVDLLVGMHYEISTRRFKNTEVEYRHYGWEYGAGMTGGQAVIKTDNDDKDEGFPFGLPDEGEAPF